MKIKNYYKKNKVIILNFVASLFTYLSLKMYNDFSFYNFFIFILFFAILYFYNIKTPNDKRVNKYSLILSIIFSLFLSIGNIVKNNLTINDIGFLNIKNIICMILMFIGFVLFFRKLFIILSKYLKKINITKFNNKLSKKETLLIFILIFLGWIILFLRFFPAIMTPDSYYVIHYSNQHILSDHHTFGFTFFFGIIFSFSKLFFNSLNASVAFYIIVQMLFIDLIFTMSIKYLSNIGLKKYICYIMAIFITINPLFAHYSVTLWRDVMFGMSLVIICMLLYDYVINKFNIKISQIILFTLAVIMMLFFRNNGIYVFIVMTPFLILIGKNKRIYKLSYCIFIIIMYFVIKGPVFDYFNISKGLSSEAYSIPIQQISRVVASNKKINKKDYKVLSKSYDVELAKSEYQPTISDKMKATINNEYLKKNKTKFYKTYLNLLIKYPNLYFEAYFTQTLGYWYPDVEYWSVGGEGRSFFEPDVRTQSFFSDDIKKLIDVTKSKKLPFSMLFWGVGFNFFLLVISTAITLYKNGKNHLLYYIPVYAVWLTLMIASPVFCELRYIYAMFAMMPFYIILPFMKKK